MKQTLLEAIKDQVLLGDGAMGTQLQQAGLEPGGCGGFREGGDPEGGMANPEGYVGAGSHCLITNTVGGCRVPLGRHGHGGGAGWV